jgi:hypothetical protein
LARRLRCNPLPLGARDAPRCCNTLETAKHSAEPSAAPTARPVVTAARGGWPEVDQADRGVIGAQSAGYRALPWLQSQGQLGPARLRELIFVNDMQSWPTNVRICRDSIVQLPTAAPAATTPHNGVRHQVGRDCQASAGTRQCRDAAKPRSPRLAADWPPIGRRCLFKLSVRLQGGPKRAAHAAAWARDRRLAVARDGHAGSPSAGVENRIGPRRRRSSAGWDMRGRRPTGAAWATRPSWGRTASHGRRAPGAAARIVSGPLLQAQGRFASHATALRAALDLGASATLGQGGQGRPMACPRLVARRRTRHRLVAGQRAVSRRT